MLVAVAVGVSVGMGVLVAVAVGVFVDVAVLVAVEVGVLVGVAVRVAVGVGVLVGVAGLVAVEVGVLVEPTPPIVNRRSSNTWSPVLERRVKLVTGFTHPVTRVWGLLPDAVILAS